MKWQFLIKREFIEQHFNGTLVGLFCLTPKLIRGVYEFEHVNKSDWLRRQRLGGVFESKHAMAGDSHLQVSDTYRFGSCS